MAWTTEKMALFAPMPLENGEQYAEQFDVGFFGMRFRFAERRAQAAHRRLDRMAGVADHECAERAAQNGQAFQGQSVQNRAKLSPAKHIASEAADEHNDKADKLHDTLQKPCAKEDAEM